MTQARPALRLFAAGSLRGVLMELGEMHAQATGAVLDATYGASGLLRERIERGDQVDLFASANMAHPLSLASRGQGGVRCFTRNRLCALLSPSLKLASADLLDAMLDERHKLGMSTPKADPSGDYAIEVFDKADRLRPGAGVALRARALQLTGGPQAPPRPEGGNVYGALVGGGQADIFLTYRTTARLAQQDVPGLRIVALPPELAVGADYGLIAFTPAGQDFADFLLGAPAQHIFAQHGFDPAG